MISRYLFLAVSLGVCLSACRSSEEKEQTTMMVKAETVKSYQNELRTTYPGRIRAAAEVDLSFRVAGPLVRMPAEVGRYVRKGDLIAEIDPRDYELQFQATEAQYNQVKAEAERVIELYNRKSVPVNDYDKAVSGLQQISSKYTAHANALRDTRLLAPFDGYIQKKYFDANETVAAGMPVISMINTEYFEIEIDIPSSDYIHQDLFRKFSCVADVFPDHVFPLALIDIAKKANLNQLYRVRLRLKPDPRLPLAAGMSVNVMIDYEVGELPLTQVPLSAVFEEKGLSMVWVYSPAEQTVTRRQVFVRQILKDGTVVLDRGVESGELVVSAGVHKLKDGMSVELLKPVAETNVGGLL